MLENKITKRIICDANSLTQRIRLISSADCYREVINRCFAGKDILSRVRTTKILNLETCQTIRLMNSHNPLFTGFFIEQLLLKSIDNYHKSNTHNKSNKSNKSNKTYAFLSSSIIVEARKYAARKDYHDKVLVQNITDRLDSYFYNDIEKIAREIYFGAINISNAQKPYILINHKLKGDYNFSIASECDLLINNTLYDVKCTKGTRVNNRIYEILQLLGYSALFRVNPKYKRQINEINVINLLQGEILSYDISDISDAQYKEYLKILNAYHDKESCWKLIKHKLCGQKNKKSRFASHVKNFCKGLLCCFKGIKNMYKRIGKK